MINLTNNSSHSDHFRYASRVQIIKQATIRQNHFVGGRKANCFELRKTPTPLKKRHKLPYIIHVAVKNKIPFYGNTPRRN